MRLMRKHGWSPGQPLGNPSRSGLQWPLDLPQEACTHGLGYSADTAATGPPTALTCSAASSSTATAAADSVAGGGASPAPYLGPCPAASSAVSFLSATESCHLDQLCCFHATVQLREDKHADPSKFYSPSHTPSTSHPDLWLDANCLHSLQFGQGLEDASAKERKRVWKRLRSYRYLTEEKVIQRLMPDGSWKTVPALS